MVRGVPSYCPYCGAELTIRRFEGRDRGYCPDCEGFVWRDPVPVAVVAVVDPDDGVLLQKRAIEPGEGNWSLPGGVLEFDEQPRDGAARELREETGLRADPTALVLDDATTSVEGNRAILRLQYLVPRSAVEGSIDPGPEATDARFFTATEFDRTGGRLSSQYRPVFERLASVAE